MATPAQIAANRANAQHSTGPRTDEGKLRASQNALRHGLCAGIPIMHDEGDLNYDHLLDALREEFQPIGPNEEILVYKMAEHFFYGKRAAYLLAEQLDSNDGGDDNAREIGLMMRYHAASDRGYYRALTELRKVQKERPHVEPDATTYPSAAGSETPPLILPPHAARRHPLSSQPAACDGKIPVNSHVQPADIGQDRSIGSVSQNATPQPVSPTDFTPEAPVFVPSASIGAPKTVQMTPQKAA